MICTIAHTVAHTRTEALTLMHAAALASRLSLRAAQRDTTICMLRRAIREQDMLARADNGPTDGHQLALCTQLCKACALRTHSARLFSWGYGRVEEVGACLLDHEAQLNSRRTNGHGVVGAIGSALGRATREGQRGGGPHGT